MRASYLFISGLLALLLMGCGAVQAVKDGTVGVAKAIFVWEIKTLHLDLMARAELNVDDEERSSPVVIRIYQLSDDESFNSASYSDLADKDSDVLGDSLIVSKEVVLKPKAALSIDEPLDGKAEYIGIVGLYKDPDLKKNNWRLVLERDDLHINTPREIIANKYTLELVEED